MSFINLQAKVLESAEAGSAGREMSESPNFYCEKTPSLPLPLVTVPEARTIDIYKSLYINIYIYLYLYINFWGFLLLRRKRNCLRQA